MSELNVKAWLYAWLQKKKVQPNYDIRPCKISLKE